MFPNKDAGLGRMLADALFAVQNGSLTTGHVYIVGASSLTNYNEISAMYGNYADGKAVLYTTITLALAQCVASRGDIIMVMPGHTEAVTATSHAMNVTGVQIIGLGRGSLRPTLTHGAAAATITVSAANMLFKNLIVVANFADVVSAWTTTTAKELQLEDVEHRDTSSILNFLNIIDTNTTSNDTDGLTLRRVKRLGAGATTATTIIKMDGTNDRLIVEDCYFAHANVDDGGLFMLIATGKVVTNMQVDRTGFNFVGVSSATAGVLVTTNGSTNSGYFRNCFVKHLDATTEIMVTASSGFVFWDLKATAVADKQGYLVPAADS